MKIIERNISDNYFSQATEKTMIVYHFTAGNMPGCEEWLAHHTEKVNVPFIVTRKGIINQYFDTDYWAYHTGVQKCKNSIGIEVECWGNLSMVNGKLLPWTNNIKQAVSPEHALMTTFRNFHWWEKLTPQQEEALDELTDMLIGKHKNIKSLVTHAEINWHKLDYPPEYRQIYDIIYKYDNKIKNAEPVFVPSEEIKKGEEHKYTRAQIQNRINELIDKHGWQNKELNRLVTYRDKFLK